ncbi:MULTISPECIES: hypothetical protein [Acidithrix]|uniref:Uncharacterized protein n=1 Tax=Acidithrix ferrooxidans TaxID=1280514 RepID=A0A0D8HKI8_9ACTN|nr:MULTISPECIES: hypothetical protein [Acidithrix]KJF18287.1 hypothetical protein AXFE_08220 [Acidithrix ferrooxidans]
MTQPDYVPVASGTQLRKFDELSNPGSWMSDRVAELPPNPHSAVEQGVLLGTPGPDSGFAIKLARYELAKISLDENEHHEDVEKAVTSVAIKRSALYSRAPVIHDVRFALKLFGYGEELSPPVELVEFRKKAFSGVAHDYFKVRRLLDLIPVATLSLSVDEIDVAKWDQYLLS